jgi:succinate dehydrogenase / fumarate reductase iron-sulfur subunit
VKFVLHVWRQAARDAAGGFERFEVDGVSGDMSFLETLDLLNERLVSSGQPPVAFDSDCREGICGACGFVINGDAHGPVPGATVCQLHMRSFRDGEELWLEPWRSRAFPVLRDLIVDRGALDRIIASGGYVSASTGSAPEAKSIPIPKADADRSMDAAACIGCGACAAACPNGSAALFTAAKIAHLGLLPQGQPERGSRALAMVKQADREGFGGCSNIGECEAACPKSIPAALIARMNRDFLTGAWAERSQFRPK